MALSREFADHLRDLFGALGPVETRRMFGGAGVYLGDAMFALVIDDTLYMKADAELAQDYAEAGSAPFSYDTRGGARTIPGKWMLVYQAAEQLSLWTGREAPLEVMAAAFDAA